MMIRAQRNPPLSYKTEFLSIFTRYFKVFSAAILTGTLFFFLYSGIDSGAIPLNPYVLIVSATLLFLFIIASSKSVFLVRLFNAVGTFFRIYFAKRLRVFQLLSAVRPVIVTLLSLILVTFLYSSSVQEAIKDFDQFSAIFLAGGAMIGTLIILLFSLSIISVQHAAEKFTPFITRLYRNDLRTNIVFLILVVLCLISFVFSVKEAVMGIPFAKLLPIQILILGITFDLARWHYRRVGLSVDTAGAIELLQGEVFRTMDDNDAPSDILYGLEELSELATKSVSKGEVKIAKNAIDSIGRITERYIESRRNNLRLFPDLHNLGAVMSDANWLMSPVNEALRDISNKAVERKIEAISIHAIECLGGIGEKLVTMGGPFERIAYMPIGYVWFAAERAFNERLLDVCLRSSKVLMHFGVAASKNSDDFNLYFTILQEHKKLIYRSFLIPDGLVGNLIQEDLLGFAHTVLNARPAVFIMIWEYLLDELNRLAPLMVLNENPRDITSPYAPYGLNPLPNLPSVGYFVRSSLLHLTEDPSQYDKFLIINEKLSLHFWRIAGNALIKNLGRSGLVWNISETIGYILDDLCFTFLSLQSSPRPNWTDDLLKHLRFYVSFYWKAFDTSETVEASYAWQSAQKLAYIGLKYYEAGFHEIANQAVNSIRSMADSTGLKATNQRHHVAGEILVFLSHFQWLATAKDDTTMIATLDKELAESDCLKDECAHSSSIRETLARQENDLKNRLIDPNYFVLGKDPTAYLKSILQNKYPQILQGIVEELYPRS